MNEIEFVGNSEDISLIQNKLLDLTNEIPRIYDQKGVDGKSSLKGLIIPVVPGVLNSIVAFIGNFVGGKQGVSIKVEGLELQVRNI